MVRSLLQLSEIWPFHIWLFVWMEFASLEANLGGVGALLSISFFFSLPLSGRSSDMTEILLTGDLSQNSIYEYLVHN